jgi:hypothetical protein
MYFTNTPDNFEFALIPMQNESHLTTTLIERVGVLPRAKTSIRKPPGRCNELKHMIGNTPLLAVRFRFKGRERVIPHSVARFTGFTFIIGSLPSSQVLGYSRASASRTSV